MTQLTRVRLFEIYPYGDPYSITYACREWVESDDPYLTWVYRGDLSGKWGPQTLARELRRLYPGCTVRKVRS